MVSSFSLYIIRFEPKKPPCVQVNSSRYFELHFWEFFPSNFGAILTPQWAPKGSGGGIFHSPRPNQVWEGGHHPTRWHLAPGTCPNRPNLVPRQVQIWANLTNFMPFSVNSHPETGSKGEFCTTHGPIRCGQVATTQPGGTWHLEPAQIGQILFPCKFKIEQIWPFSCHFPAIFPPTKGLFRNLYVTQGLIRSGQNVFSFDWLLVWPPGPFCFNCNSVDCVMD